MHRASVEITISEKSFFLIFAIYWPCGPDCASVFDRPRLTYLRTIFLRSGTTSEAPDTQPSIARSRIEQSASFLAYLRARISLNRSTGRQQSIGVVRPMHTQPTATTSSSSLLHLLCDSRPGEHLHHRTGLNFLTASVNQDSQERKSASLSGSQVIIIFGLNLWTRSNCEEEVIEARMCKS